MSSEMSHNKVSDHPENMNVLKNRIKILERDLKNARKRILKLKTQKNKLLEKLVPHQRIHSSSNTSASLFFNHKEGMRDKR